MAAVVGDRRPDEAVVAVSHLQMPGACDNASGVAGLLEGAISLSGMLRAGELPWPSRTLVFLWGDEFRQSEAWLEATQRAPVAAISAILTGDSPAATGGPLLLERQPDPGALVTLPPDEHTAWGAGEVERDTILPAGLNVIARCALADVRAAVGGEWATAEHPWEGGTDHDVFLGHGVPAILFWHFSGLIYHTSLDRPAYVDPEELRRTAAATLATALAVADPRPEDLERYLACVDLEEELRLAAAEEAEDEDLAREWRTWSEGARAWLRAECGGGAGGASASDDR